MPLRRINTLLLIAIIIINGITLSLPVLPGVLFWARSQSPQVQVELAQQAHTPPQKPNQPNALIIPTLLMNQPILEGQTEDVLLNGLWRRPHLSTPDAGGHTVIAGHRFSYTNLEATFYSLDKLQLGDEIALTWNNKTYTYKTTNIAVVPANATHVEVPTTEPQLTLYTCTPFWTFTDRLVVTAKLESTYE